MLQNQLKSEFLGWLFYAGGTALLVVMLVHSVSDYEPSDLFFLWLCVGCGWVGGFLQYRFPVGGARTAPGRSQRRAAALGPRYKLGQRLLVAGVVLGGAVTVLSVFLEKTALGEIGSVVVFALGTATAAGAIALGRRLQRAAEKAAATKTE